MKTKTLFYCTECGNETPKWQGKCPACGAWNTIVERPAEKAARKSPAASRGSALGVAVNRPRTMAEVETTDELRFPTGMGELDRVLGGGAVRGSLVLVGGAPGIGKSTLMLQICDNLCRFATELNVYGEESERQIKLRAERLRVRGEGLHLLSETNLENVVDAVHTVQPGVLVVDSIQTLYHGDVTAAPGSISQVKECTMALMQLAKGEGITVFVIGHVNKEGSIAGPKVLEHMVDCVLSFTGERSHEMRILRAQKNRFGTTSEIGAFEMAEGGLMEIEKLSETLLEVMGTGSDGAVATAVYEGTRPLILEVQALTAASGAGFARRTAIGIENPRLSMIIAVLERKTGISLGEQDVYVNIVGGIRPEGTYTDLAVAAAVYSSFRGVPFGSKVLLLGEIGLTGDLRAVQHSEKILKEAARMGFERIVLPIKNAERLKKPLAEINSARRARGSIQTKTPPKYIAFIWWLRCKKIDGKYTHSKG